MAIILTLLSPFHPLKTKTTRKTYILFSGHSPVSIKSLIPLIPILHIPIVYPSYLLKDLIQIQLSHGIHPIGQNFGQENGN